MDFGNQDILLSLALRFPRLLLQIHRRLYTRVASVEHGARIARQQRKRRSSIRLELCLRQRGTVPHKVDRVENPQIRQIPGLVGRVLEAAKQNDVLLPVRHAMTAPRGWTLILALDLDLRPFPGGGLQPPKVRVMVEGALLGRRELAAKEVDVVGIRGTSPCMSRARQRGIR